MSLTVAARMNLRKRMLSKYAASMNSLGRDAANPPVLTSPVSDRLGEAKAEATETMDSHEAISTWDDTGQI